MEAELTPPAPLAAMPPPPTADPRAPLRILLVEDSEDDAALVLLELKRLGYDPVVERVEARDALRAALAKAWDLVICDYNLPSMDAPTALGIVKEVQADLPMLVMSGTTSEAQAVVALKAGAHDFFRKEDLSRLGPAIERELREAEGRRARRRAETALKKSELRFREVLENISDLVLLLSPQGGTLYASPSVKRLLGYTPEEMETVRLADLLRSDPHVLDDLLREARVSGEAGGTRELALARKGGGEVLFEVGVRDATPLGLGYILSARDVTLRREAERSLALAEERLRLAVEAGRLATWYMDISSGWVQVTPAGWQHPDWPAANAGDFQAMLAWVHPDDRARVEKEIARALTGEAGFDAQYRLPPEEGGGKTRWVHSIGKAFRDGKGRPDRFIGVSMDISDAKASELLLLETQERLKAALLGSNAGTFKFDLASRAFECDEALCELLGMPEGGTRRAMRELLDLAHPDDRSSLERAFERAISEGVDIDEEFRLRPDGGDVRWISAKGKNTGRSAGEPRYMMGACVDITSRHHVLEQFRQSQKMEAIGRLAGGIAHDFNNLLTVINGYAEVTLSLTGPGTDLYPPLSEIHNAGRRAAALTQQLLAFSRKQILMPQLVCLDGIVESMTGLLQRLIGEDIRIVIRAESAGLRVKVDPGQMNQVILNLAVNSRDAMPAGGEIRIETFPAGLEAPLRSIHGEVPRGEYVALRVTDTGCGMAPGVQARIFEPFFTTKEIGKGTGLGLSMVYGMVRQSEGHIHVASSPGAGTAVTLYLPVSGGSPSEAAAGPEPETATLTPGVKSILLVEDEESVLRFLTTILDQAGYRVQKARSAAEALAIAARGETLDLLVTDVVMGHAGGKNLFRSLRASQPRLRVLFISGYAMEEDILSGWEQDADYLQKPFQPADLLERVRGLLLRKAPSAA